MYVKIKYVASVSHHKIVLVTFSYLTTVPSGDQRTATDEKFLTTRWWNIVNCLWAPRHVVRWEMLQCKWGCSRYIAADLTYFIKKWSTKPVAKLIVLLFVEHQAEPDDFFDVTVDDVRKMLADLKHERLVFLKAIVCIRRCYISNKCSMV